jgi:hypothetical protein
VPYVVPLPAQSISQVYPRYYSIPITQERIAPPASRPVSCCQELPTRWAAYHLIIFVTIVLFESIYLGIAFSNAASADYSILRELTIIFSILILLFLLGNYLVLLCFELSDMAPSSLNALVRCFWIFLTMFRIITVPILLSVLRNTIADSKGPSYMPSVVYAGYSATELLLLFICFCFIHKERVCDFQWQ